ncbi:hypothetical protein MNBD_NITROSPIRAE02-1366 [hydrothermal vent metagenome]|uniref:Uncharacterized protein n=1 Tax=hydrothermal vent metagenome TaxID=652676 RepID=A0A3B1C939_9ZZZZ
MKYMMNGGFKMNSFMRLTLSLTLVFFVGFWITNFLLFFHKTGLSYKSVVDYYLGSEAEFTAPRSYQGMLEVTHFHMPMMGLVILLLTHLLLFVPIRNGWRMFWVVIPFLSALTGEASGWLVRFLHPGFAYLKILAFCMLQISLGGVLGLLFWGIWRKDEKKMQDGDSRGL